MNLKQKINILFLFICAIQLSAQNYQFQNFSLDDGLPQSQVFDIVQDATGYLWLGTQGGGIAKFDGKNFKVYNDKNGLSSNFVNALLFKNDSLFIGTNQGLSIKIKNIFHNFKIPRVSKIVVIQNRVFLTTQKGIYLLKKEYASPLKIDLKIDTSLINDLLFDGDFYWIASEKGLWKVNDLQQPTQIIKIDSKPYTSLLLNRKNIIAATYTNGIKIIDLEKAKTIHQSIKQITGIQKMNTNEIWVATKQKGIVILSTENYAIINKINRSNGLKNAAIQKIYKERQGIIWLASSGDGLYKLMQHQFKHFNKNKTISALHQNNKTLWFSDSENNMYTIDSLGSQKIKRHQYIFKTTSITSDKTDAIWVGSSQNGIFIFREIAIFTDSIDTKNTHIEQLNMSNGFPYNEIQDIITQEQEVWVATKKDGIVKLEYDFKKGVVKNIKRFNQNNGLLDLTLNMIVEDYPKRIWYTTKKGAIGYIQNDSVQHFSQVLKEQIAINTAVIDKGQIFLGTSGKGIWVSNITIPLNFHPLKGSKKLNSNNIFQLFFDANHNLWVGTEKGSARIQLNTSSIITDVTHFGENDGFLGIETIPNTITKGIKGSLWFGTINGLTQYIPSQEQKKLQKPQVFFEDIEVAYEFIDSINVNAFHSVLQLSHKKNHIAFAFKTVDLNHPESIEYRWKLNDGFSTWKSENTIRFANLKPGKYTFSVQSRNRDWQESKPKEFQFFIDKPLHKKAWFILLLTGILSFFFGWIIYRYIKKVNEKNEQKVLQLKLEKHLLSLEQKALQLQMNPHFIFNVLNGIKALGNSGDTSELNKTISQFASLLRAVLNNSRQKEISLKQEIATLKNYIELEHKMTSKMFDYNFQTDTNGFDVEEILIPPMLIQPFVENSIKHGIGNLSKKGKLEISFTAKNDFLHCKITDNGIGIKQSMHQKAANDHHSLAVKVTQERIESLSNKNAFEIKEIYENAEIIGTLVTFKIPLKTDY